MEDGKWKHVIMVISRNELSLTLGADLLGLIEILSMRNNTTNKC